MRKGSGSKQKGASYERSICQQLSLWISAGRFDDGLWRSAMSGGRATVRYRKGHKTKQVGDITSVRPETSHFTAKHFVECKHYRNLAFPNFFLSGTGTLAQFWLKAVEEADKHEREPILIARQNRMPDVVITRPRTIDMLAANLRGACMLVVEGPLPTFEVRLLKDVLASEYKPK